MHLEFIYTMYMSQACYFLGLSDISLYECTTFHLSIHQLKDILSSILWAIMNKATIITMNTHVQILREQKFRFS